MCLLRSARQVRWGVISNIHRSISGVVGQTRREPFPSRTNDYTPWKINMEPNNQLFFQRKFIWTKPPSLGIPALKGATCCKFTTLQAWVKKDVSQRFDVRFTGSLWTKKSRKIQQVIYCGHYLYEFWTDDINQLALRPCLAPCSHSNFKSGSNMKCQPHWSRRIRLVEARKKLWMGQWGNIPNIPKESRRKSCLQSHNGVLRGRESSWAPEKNKGHSSEAGWFQKIWSSWIA